MQLSRAVLFASSVASGAFAVVVAAVVAVAVGIVVVAAVLVVVAAVAIAVVAAAAVVVVAAVVAAVVAGAGDCLRMQFECECEAGDRLCNVKRATAYENAM